MEGREEGKKVVLMEVFVHYSFVLKGVFVQYSVVVKAHLFSIRSRSGAIQEAGEVGK